MNAHDQHLVQRYRELKRKTLVPYRGYHSHLSKDYRDSGKTEAFLERYTLRLEAGEGPEGILEETTGKHGE